MKGEPGVQAGFEAHEQGFEAIESGIHLLNDLPTLIQLGDEQRIVVSLPVRRSMVARDIDLDVAAGAGLVQCVDIKSFIGIYKQHFRSRGCCQQVAEFGKEGIQRKRIVVLPSLGRRHS